MIFKKDVFEHSRNSPIYLVLFTFEGTLYSIYSFSHPQFKTEKLVNIMSIGNNNKTIMDLIFLASIFSIFLFKNDCFFSSFSTIFLCNKEKELNEKIFQSMLLLELHTLNRIYVKRTVHETKRKSKAERGWWERK